MIGKSIVWPIISVKAVMMGLRFFVQAGIWAEQLTTSRDSETAFQFCSYASPYLIGF